MEIEWTSFQSGWYFFTFKSIKYAEYAVNAFQRCLCSPACLLQRIYFINAE